MDETKQPLPTKIITHYIKNNDFKTVLATGVIGGITMQSLINIDFITDRTTIPTKIENAVEFLPGGKAKAGKELLKESKEGSIREVQFGVLMDLQTTKVFIKWLQEKVELIEKHEKQKT